MKSNLKCAFKPCNNRTLSISYKRQQIWKRDLSQKHIWRTFVFKFRIITLIPTQKNFNLSKIGCLVHRTSAEKEKVAQRSIWRLSRPYPYRILYQKFDRLQIWVSQNIDHIYLSSRPERVWKFRHVSRSRNEALSKDVKICSGKMQQEFRKQL